MPPICVDAALLAHHVDHRVRRARRRTPSSWRRSRPQTLPRELDHRASACRGRCRRTGPSSRARSGSPDLALDAAAPKPPGTRMPSACDSGSGGRPARAPRSRRTSARPCTSLAMPPWTSASFSDLVRVGEVRRTCRRCAIVTVVRAGSSARSTMLLATCDEVAVAPGQMCSSSSTISSRPSACEARAAPRRSCATSGAAMTRALLDVAEERDLLLHLSRERCGRCGRGGCRAGCRSRAAPCTRVLRRLGLELAGARRCTAPA